MVLYTIIYVYTYGMENGLWWIMEYSGLSTTPSYFYTEQQGPGGA